VANRPKPKLAVWKFASCDGCQLSLLDCEDELLAVAGAVEIANAGGVVSLKCA
jgi:sulfhydrogenase subunit delta